MYKCSECDFQSMQWFGKCPQCSSWNTFIEIKESGSKKNKKRKSSNAKRAKSIKEIEGNEEIRFSSGITEFDNVLGGGIVKGSVVLIGGQPGIGKSTLLMQVAGRVAQKLKVLYVTAEESDIQVRLRADRLGINSENVLVLSDFSLQNIISNIEQEMPDLLIIDSIQTLKSENVGTIPGTIGQIRECASMLSDIAKSNGIPLFLVAQINKEGNIAGPKHLEHLVDTVLYFDESKDYTYRVLRAIKNRFGPANEIGIFEMHSNGLNTITEHVLVKKLQNVPGLQLVVSIEGIRPLITEIQALVTETGFSMPQRMAEGYDRNRLMFLLAVLEKKSGVFFRNQDVFLNVPGAVRLSDPGVELGICMALLSSFYNAGIDSQEYAFIGEVGLTGEIRAVPYFEKRLGELEKIGVKKVITSKPHRKEKIKSGLELVYHNNISEVIKEFFR